MFWFQKSKQKKDEEELKDVKKRNKETRCLPNGGTFDGNGMASLNREHQIKVGIG